METSLTSVAHSANFSCGERVFAKVDGFRPWPARIEAIVQAGDRILYNMFFYGTYERCQVDAKHVYKYDLNKAKFKKYRGKKNSHKFALGMKEIECHPDLEPLSASSGIFENSNSNVQTDGSELCPSLSCMDIEGSLLQCNSNEDLNNVENIVHIKPVKLAPVRKLKAKYKLVSSNKIMSEAYPTMKGQNNNNQSIKKFNNNRDKVLLKPRPVKVLKRKLNSASLNNSRHMKPKYSSSNPDPARAVKLLSFSIGNGLSMDIMCEYMDPSNVLEDHSSSHWNNSANMIRMLNYIMEENLVDRDIDGSFLFDSVTTKVHPSIQNDISEALQSLKLEYLLTGINRELAKYLHCQDTELDLNRCLYLMDRLNCLPVDPFILIKNPEFVLIAKSYAEFNHNSLLQRKAEKLLLKCKNVFNCQDDEQFMEKFLKQSNEYQKISEVLPERFHNVTSS